MNNKNAYEIRLEILQLANSNLLGQASSQIDWLYRRYDSNKTIPTPEEIEALRPSVEDILTHARELYAFVEG